MATVYVWKNTRHTGHCSIKIENGQSYSYVSFHPNLSGDPRLSREDIIANNRYATNSTIEILSRSYPSVFSSKSEDVKSYGEPEQFVNVFNLDMRAINHYMETEFESETQNYSLKRVNCCNIVAKILLVGIHEHVANESFWKGVYTKLKHERSLSDRAHYDKYQFNRWPEAIVNTLEANLRYIAAGMARSRPSSAKAAALAVIAGLDFVKRGTLWTPSDVLNLAYQINDHLDNA